MTFVALLIALSIERFFDFSHLRGSRWYAVFLQTVIEKMPHQKPMIQLAAGIIPFLLAVALLQLVFQGVLYGFPLLIFKVVILLACLGPQDLWADAFACINFLETAEKNTQSDQLKNTFGIKKVDPAQSANRLLLQKILLESQPRVFGVVFWFFVLGPVGAVGYRLATLIAGVMTVKVDSPPTLVPEARQLVTIMDWLPVRLLTLFFALGGHFMRVFESWRRDIKQGLVGNEIILTSSGVAALGYGEDEAIPADGTAERAAVSLIDRVLVILLVLVGLLVYVV